MAISRVLVGELLDDLAPGDPAAQRSRRDLRRLNALMGNFPWVQGRLRAHLEALGSSVSPPVQTRVVEIGAGEGLLCRRLASRFPAAQVTGIDQVPRPAGLNAEVKWRQGDLFSVLPDCQGDVLIGVMILHHFSKNRLRDFLPSLQGFRRLCFCEPWRNGWTLGLSAMMHAWVGPVTRHDMPTSIRAGFLPGELPAFLGLPSSGGWKLRESWDLRGVLRLEAWRE